MIKLVCKDDMMKAHCEGTGEELVKELMYICGGILSEIELRDAQTGEPASLSTKLMTFGQDMIRVGSRMWQEGENSNES